MRLEVKQGSLLLQGPQDVKAPFGENEEVRVGHLSWCWLVQGPANVKQIQDTPQPAAAQTPLRFPHPRAQPVRETWRFRVISSLG